jgi:hypothetical protein
MHNVMFPRGPGALSPLESTTKGTRQAPPLLFINWLGFYALLGILVLLCFIGGSWGPATGLPGQSALLMTRYGLACGSPSSTARKERREKIREQRSPRQIFPKAPRGAGGGWAAGRPHPGRGAGRAHHPCAQHEDPGEGSSERPDAAGVQRLQHPGAGPSPRALTTLCEAHCQREISLDSIQK